MHPATSGAYRLSVSSLNEQIKGLLEESFSQVLVEGELSRITFHNSGHIYFTLKDSSSVVSCVMFRGNASKLKFRLEEGMKVIINAALTLYKPRGSYQLNCFSIEPSGEGALSVAFEQLKQKLSSLGYFNEDIKKELPRFPSRIALITSSTGAALQDMLRVANSRYKLVEIEIYNVLVQGVNAATDISNAIISADTKGYDIIVVSRGGGSVEDLWAFNEELVAQTIYRAKTPIVSAVGHEIDWVISDFVADVRAATPSVAMQICLPDTNELYQHLDAISSRLSERITQNMLRNKQELTYMFDSYSQHSLERKLTLKMQELQSLKENFNQSIFYKTQNCAKEIESTSSKFPFVIDSVVNSSRSKLANIKKMLESNNPKLKSKIGYAQISQDSKVVDLSSLDIGELFDIQNSEYSMSAKIVTKNKI